MQSLPKLSTCLLMLAIAGTAHSAAAPHAKSKHSHIGKHQHGVANIDIANLNGAFELQLRVPAMDLLGFEHQPSTTNERTASEQLSAKLQNFTSYFSVDGSCKLDSVKVSMPSYSDEHHHEHEYDDDHEDERDEEHDDEHEHDDHDHQHKANHDHEHEHKSKHEHGHKHGDINASYKLSCKQAPQQFSSSLFAQFASLQKIDVQYISAKKQGAEQLTATNNSIKF